MKILNVFLLLPLIVFFLINVTASIYAFIKEKNARSLVGTIVVSAIFTLTVFFFSGFDGFFFVTNTLVCSSRLNKIGTALQMYKTDNRGLYPDSLKNLSPSYLREIPKCVEGDFDRKTREFYWKTYGLNLGDYRYEVTKDRKRYTLTCPGNNHDFYPPNRPMLSSREGLITR